MKNTLLRESDGRIKGVLDGYWLHTHEDENWKDQKVSADKMMFPKYKGNMNGDCVTYSIDQLKTN